MACDLSLGRKEPCKDVVGGIKNVYFTDFGDFGTVTLTDDEITTCKLSIELTMLMKCYEKSSNVCIN